MAAASTGAATSAGSEVDALVADLAQLQHAAIGERQDVRRVERFQWFLALALAALVAAQSIPDRLAVRSVTRAAACGAPGPGGRLTCARPYRDSHTCRVSAHGLRRRQCRPRQRAAATTPTNSRPTTSPSPHTRRLWRRAPALPQALYNLGNAHYRLQEGEQAQRALEDAAAAAGESGSGAGSDMGAQAWYNLGNVRFAAEDFAGAVEAYKEALRRTPGDMDAKVNLELALRRRQENEEQQEQPEETPTPTPTPEQQPPPEGESTPTATPTPTQSAPATPDPAQPTPAPSATPTAPPTATPTAVPTATPAAPVQSQAQTEPGATPPSQLPPDAPPGTLTEEQARRILEAAASGTQTLQEAMQGVTPPDGSVEKDW